MFWVEEVDDGVPYPLCWKNNSVPWRGDFTFSKGAQEVSKIANESILVLPLNILVFSFEKNFETWLISPNES